MATSSDVLTLTLRRLRELSENQGLPSATLVKLALRPFWTIVVGSQSRCGIAINFTDPQEDSARLREQIAEYQSLLGTDLFEVAARLLGQDDRRSRSVAAAALSALSQPFLTPESLASRGFSVREGGTDIDSLVTGNDVVAMVGYAGILGRIVGKCRELHVTEMRPRQAFQTIVVGEEVQWGPQEVTVHTAAENEEVLGNADVVFITASTLVNGTFGEVVGFARNARLVVLYGPTGSLIPDVVFERGIDLVLTMVITDPSQFVANMVDVNAFDSQWSTGQPFQGQRFLAVARAAAREKLAAIGWP